MEVQYRKMKSKSITDIGSKRKVNQDYIYNKDDGIGLLSNLYIVADGMGGHKAGDYASRECVNSIVGYIEKHTECYTPISLLENAIINANNNINEQSNNNPELEGMGTTIVAAICGIRPGRVYCRIWQASCREDIPDPGNVCRSIRF